MSDSTDKNWDLAEEGIVYEDLNGDRCWLRKWGGFEWHFRWGDGGQGWYPSMIATDEEIAHIVGNNLGEEVAKANWEKYKDLFNEPRDQTGRK